MEQKNNTVILQEGVKILSLFDGMACGMIAMINAGIKINRYVAFEVDKYAIKTSTHNFPMIEHKGDVFEGNFTEFEGFDFLIGGSPCTYWSIAQKNNRETEASGLGWELFNQYVRALNEAKPKFFIYENNKSMSKAIRESITETFGFEPICINSALVSAQNRQRLYWVGQREENGTYSKVDIEQPVDKGIVVRDILESGDDLTSNEKSYALTTRCNGAIPEDTIKKRRHTMVVEPVRVGAMPRPNGDLSTSQAFRIYDVNAKSVTINSGGGGAGGKTGLYAVPLKVGQINGGGQGNRIYSIDGKAVSQTATSGGMGSNTGLYIMPLEEDTGVIPFVESKLEDAQKKFGYIPEIWNPYNNAEIKDKAPTQTTGCGSKTTSATVLVTSSICYAEPCEWDEEGKPIKAISYADGKSHIVYEVVDGLIAIKGKQYPIKLPNGYYIIRKLTVRECMRLQTVPEWYEFPVSDSQAYKMLGNGWTCDVITHLIKSTKIFSN